MHHINDRVNALVTIKQTDGSLKAYEVNGIVINIRPSILKIKLDESSIIDKDDPSLMIGEVWVKEENCTLIKDKD